MGILIGGLVSITFRQLAPLEIVELVATSGLSAIEWGGDVHAPHGDLDTATTVRAMTEDAGLTVSAYGSYYRVGESEQEGLDFRRVLDSANALGAPVIRVWAGRQGSAEADPKYRRRIVGDSRRIADQAESVDIRIAFEYHGNTLTDTNESAQQLLEDVDHANINTFWQPPNDQDDNNCADGLRAVLPRLESLHVFHWARMDGKNERRPLSEGIDRWTRFFDLARHSDRDHHAMIEFVRNDDPQQFLADARALSTLLQ
ncbi:MAG: TIM barrel protein [Candidatus Poribacteria bacterium]|nr:TIM barrel protein [Candidatus Poribacteria bacterium]